MTFTLFAVLETRVGPWNRDLDYQHFFPPITITLLKDAFYAEARGQIWFSCFAFLFLSEQTLKRMSLSLFLNNSLQNFLVVVRTSLASSPPQKIILEGGIWEWLQGEVWGNVWGGLRVGLQSGLQGEISLVLVQDWICVLHSTQGLRNTKPSTSVQSSTCP